MIFPDETGDSTGTDLDDILIASLELLLEKLAERLLDLCVCIGNRVFDNFDSFLSLQELELLFEVGEEI